MTPHHIMTAIAWCFLLIPVGIGGMLLAGALNVLGGMFKALCGWSPNREAMSARQLLTLMCWSAVGIAIVIAIIILIMASWHW